MLLLLLSFGEKLAQPSMEEQREWRQVLGPVLSNKVNKCVRKREATHWEQKGADLAR